MSEPQSDPETNPELLALRPAYQRARVVGLVLCVAWPLFLMVLTATGAVKPGQNAPAGAVKQLGYTFTGLVFLSAAYVTWRSGKVMAGFRDLAPAERPRVVFRESLAYAAIFELSCLFGLLYWMLVGKAAWQHSMMFMALSPLMFFFFVPRFHAWQLALERKDG